MKIHLIAVVIASAISSNISLAETPDVEWQDPWQEGGETHFQRITGTVSDVTNEGFLVVELKRFGEEEITSYKINGLSSIVVNTADQEVDKDVMEFISLERRVLCTTSSTYNYYFSNGFSEGGCSIILSGGRRIHIPILLRRYGLEKDFSP